MNAWASVIRNVKVSGQGVSECGGDYQDVCKCKKVCGYEDKCRGESDSTCEIEIVGGQLIIVGMQIW